ncbi:hypothetical protein EVAR_53677_1 [Eumeta japonica]|uniref:Uncharacterized protein n=1 Tax=Eumeta variegata TaxID=151549 RepID=A0A4C1YQ51_EUMVA|nr:hypothetical protein EVAR_53677_1 [Eumeta japonica]
MSGYRKAKITIFVLLTARKQLRPTSTVTTNELTCEFLSSVGLKHSIGASGTVSSSRSSLVIGFEPSPLCWSSAGREPLTLSGKRRDKLGRSLNVPPAD